MIITWVVAHLVVLVQGVSTPWPSGKSLLEQPGCETVAFCASVVGPVCGVDADGVRVRLAGDEAWSPPQRLGEVEVPSHGELAFELSLQGRSSDAPCEFGGAMPRVEARGGNGGGVSAGAARQQGGGQVWRVSVPVKGAGKYVVRGDVDFDRCEGAARCDAKGTVVAGVKLFAVAVRVVAAPEGPPARNATPGWAVSENRLEWVPRPRFDLAKLRGLWIHGVGMSMMRTFLSDVVDVLARATGEAPFRRPPPHGGRGSPLFPMRCDRKVHPDAEFARLGTRVTMLCHDLGVEPKNGGALNATSHLAAVGGGVPDVVVVNKGLHVAQALGGAGDAAAAVLGDYYASVRAHLAAFQGAVPRVYWRRTLPTQFRRAGARPPNSWSCRAPERLRCLNGIADAALRDGGAARPGVVDSWDLALVRPDCTRDNRHYTHENCGATMAALFLAELAPADEAASAPTAQDRADRASARHRARLDALRKRRQGT